MQQAMPGLQNLQHVGPGSATGCRLDSEAEPGTAARLEPPLVRRARDRSHTPRAARHAPKRTTAGQVTVAPTGSRLRGNSGQSLTMRCDLS